MLDAGCSSAALSSNFCPKYQALQRLWGVAPRLPLELLRLAPFPGHSCIAALLQVQCIQVLSGHPTSRGPLGLHNFKFSVFSDVLWLASCVRCSNPNLRVRATCFASNRHNDALLVSRSTERRSRSTQGRQVASIDNADAAANNARQGNQRLARYRPLRVLRPGRNAARRSAHDEHLGSGSPVLAPPASLRSAMSPQLQVQGQVSEAPG